MTNRLDLPADIQHLIEKREEAERRKLADRRDGEVSPDSSPEIDPSDGASDQEERRLLDERRQSNRRGPGAESQ